MKRLVLRNIYWFLLKFKKKYINADSEGDYTTVVTGKLLFGDLYIIKVENYYKNKLVAMSKLQKTDLFPEQKEPFNPFENYLKIEEDIND